MKKVSVTSFFILAALVGIRSAAAHSCITYQRVNDKEHALELNKVDAIFYGKVISIAEKEDWSERETVYLEVIRAWKGIEEPVTAVEYRAAYTTFEKEKGGPGLEHYFYATKGYDGKLYVEYCSVDGLFDTDRLTPQLGEPKTFPDLPIVHIAEDQSIWQGIWNWITSWF